MVPHDADGWAGSAGSWCPLRGMPVPGIPLSPQAGKPPLEEEEEECANPHALMGPDWE